jgi:hypothetical protein
MMTMKKKKKKTNLKSMKQKKELFYPLLHTSTNRDSNNCLIPFLHNY